MEAVILMGIQGSGKSSFYRRHFFDTHLRLNLDQLKSRHRLNALLTTCLTTQTPFVWDLTNASRAERAQIIALARLSKFCVSGYFFPPDLAANLARNAAREGRARIPEIGVRATLARLQPPNLDEGFNALFAVSIDENGEFQIENWLETPFLPAPTQNP